MKRFQWNRVSLKHESESYIFYLL